MDYIRKKACYIAGIAYTTMKPMKGKPSINDKELQYEIEKWTRLLCNNLSDHLHKIKGHFPEEVICRKEVFIQAIIKEINNVILSFNLAENDGEK